MRRYFLSYKSSSIAFHCKGEGKNLLLALHGYGETGRHFSALAAALPEGWVLCAPDLPFHGETVWKEDHFDEIILKEILELFFSERNWPMPVHLAGYSMGGRLALALYQSFPENFRTITLMAPDGFKMNFWYWFSTQTWCGNRVFRYAMHNPKWFVRLAKWGSKWKLVNPGANKFIQRYLGDPKVRVDLYRRWTAMRHFRPDKNKLRNLIVKFRTPVQVFYGEHDRIITRYAGEKFRAGLEEQVHIHILAAGHQLLHAPFTGIITQKLVQAAEKAGK